MRIINLTTKTIYASKSAVTATENVTPNTITRACYGSFIHKKNNYAYVDLNNNPCLTEGHLKEPIPRKGISYERAEPLIIKELISGEVFTNTITALAKKFNKYQSHIWRSIHWGCAIENKYVFCKIDKNGKEILTTIHKEAIENINKKYAAWQKKDLKMQNIQILNIIEAKKLVQTRKKNYLQRDNIILSCEGANRGTNGWVFAYLDENQKPILTENHLKTYN